MDEMMEEGNVEDRGNTENLSSVMHQNIPLTNSNFNK